MWYSVTGSIVPIGQLYSGQLRPGDRAATVDEVAAWQAAQPLQPVTFLQFMALFTPTEQAAIVGSTDPQVKLFTLMASGAAKSIRPTRKSPQASIISANPASSPRRAWRKCSLSNRRLDPCRYCCFSRAKRFRFRPRSRLSKTPTRRRWRVRFRSQARSPRLNRVTRLRSRARFPSRALSLQAGWSTPHR